MSRINHQFLKRIARPNKLIARLSRVGSEPKFRLGSANRSKIKEQIAELGPNRLRRLLKNEKRLDRFSERLTSKLGLNEELSNQVRRFVNRRITELKKTGAIEGAASAASTSAMSGGHSGGISNEFVWKPVSESNGNLVILLPANMAGDVASVEVVGPGGKTLARGKSTGYANGGREHFRFDKPGGSFPPGSSVRITTDSGEVKTIKIDNPSGKVKA